MNLRNLRRSLLSATVLLLVATAVPAQGAAVLTPSISGFSPSSAAVGTTVTIYGSNLTGVTSVTFPNGATQSTVNVVSASQLTAAVPPAASGSGVLTVSNTKKTATSANLFFVTPTISSISPTSGGSNSTITVTGTGLATATGANFTGTAANAAASSNTTAAVTVPDLSSKTGAKSTVTIMTPGGSATSTQQFSQTSVGYITTFDAVAVTSGSQHTCALKAEGSVWCWGRGTEGQLGDGAALDSLYPVQVLTGAGIPLTGVASVQAGADRTCAVRGTGTVYCWGYNDYGGIGDGTLTQRSYATQVRGPGGTGVFTGATSVTVGTYHSCAVKFDATAWCWGYEGDGLAPGGNNNTPALVALSGVTEVSAGARHSCALLTDGTVWCWGRNNYGQLGDDGIGGGEAPVQVVTGATPTALTGIASIGVGSSHSCAVRGSDGSVWCWGHNSQGQLGIDSTSSSDVAVQVLRSDGGAPLEGVVRVSAGALHTCARVGAAAWCWGDNDNGQLGDGGTTDLFTASPVALDGIVAISAGGDQEGLGSSSHTCALVSGSDNVRCWGANDLGQLGSGTGVTDDSPDPLTVRPFPAMRSVAEGSSHTCGVVAAGGGVYCWGDNGYQQLGDGGLSYSYVPVPVRVDDEGTPLTGAIQVDVGDIHSCALISPGGTVWCWGYDDEGELGDGPTISSDVGHAVQVSGLSGVTSLSVGDYHACALLASGGVMCWGANGRGELGDGTRTDRPAPVPAKRLTDVSSIDAGSYRTCAVRRGGVLCWGWNGYGALGDGTTTDRLAPTPVKAPSGKGSLAGVVTVRGAGESTCALTTTALLYCWGRNLYGQLGDGTTQDRSLPALVVGIGAATLSGVVELAANYWSYCARLGDGTAACWGLNQAGQLGDGTVVNRHSPTRVLIAGQTGGVGMFAPVVLTGVTQLGAGGYYHACAVTGPRTRCWGSGSYGRLGTGNTAASRLPAIIVPPLYE